jgi:phage tail sheath protein FI
MVNHGVNTGETPTSIASIIQSGNTAVIVGTSPVNMASDPKVNVPVLCYTEKEAIAAFGYHDNWKDYSLCEAISVFFRLFKVGPVVLVNVLDPEIHKEGIVDKAITFTDGVAVVDDIGVLLNTLDLTYVSDSTQKTLGTDYTAAFKEDGTVTLVGLNITDGAYKVSFDKLKPSLVDEDDIIGGVDAITFKSEGFATIPQVFTKFNRVPNIGLAPGWTHKPAVAQSLVSSMRNINEVFNGIALTDIDADTVDNYTKVAEWKNDNSYIHETQYNFWPRACVGTKIYHISTLVAASMYEVDQDNNDIPYESPSNKALNTTGICLEDGTEVDLILGQANYLNDNGVATSINFNNGWRLWGNRTGCYPSNTDVKDNTISCKRMFIWDNNNFTLTFWLDVDKPADNKLMDKIVDSYNDYYNGLVTKSVILGGRIEFNSEDNPTTSLIDGKYYFKRYMTPVGVAECIESDLEYDVEYLQNLFGGGN